MDELPRWCENDTASETRLPVPSGGPFFFNRQMNSWVASAQVVCQVSESASSRIRNVRKPHDLLMVTFALLFSPSSTPLEICFLALKWLSSSSR